MTPPDICIDIRVDTSGFKDAIERLGRAYASFHAAIASSARKSASTWHTQKAPALYGTQYRKHRARCRICNPAANPPPLRVNGTEYARRRRNRTRR